MHDESPKRETVGRRMRFGAFDVDIGAGELRKGGVPVRLQVQPFQVLAALLERPGQLVSRKQLKSRIWPTDTGIDFEHGLNKAINRLRAALEDPPAAPQIIETLARRGYRFIASVQPRIDSIVVLPLQSLSRDAGQEFWADGITDELTIELARASTLRVVSRTSAMRYKESTLPLDEIARALNVDAIIHGSLVVAERRLRLRLQLIDPYSDRHIWAEAYDHELGDVIALQSAIAEGVAKELRVVLNPRRGTRALRGLPLRSEAYELYLRGRFFWNTRTEAHLTKAIEYFERAIELEPEYGAAYAGLADAQMLRGTLGLRPPHEVYSRARSAAVRALELDETLAEAHATLGEIAKNYEWDWQRSEQEFLRALELDSNRVTARMWYAHLHVLTGRNEEAIRQAEWARDLDPLSLVVGAFLGTICMKARRSDLAIRACRSAMELDPQNPFGHWMLSRALDAEGATKDALAAAELAAKLSSGGLPYAAHLGYLRAKTGDRAGARTLIEALDELARTTYVSAFDVALIHVGLREDDEAFACFERARQERCPRLPELLDPMFDVLRADPRLQALVRCMGLD